MPKLKEKLKERFQGKGELADRLFTKMDTNKDGKVSKEELTKWFEGLGKGKFEGKGKLGEKLFERLDENEDGYLSKEELRKMADLKGKLGDKGLLDRLKERLKRE